MKNLSPLLILLLILISACKNNTSDLPVAEIERLNKENQELKNKLNNKEEEINSFIQSFNQIEDNLAAIKEKENILRKNTEGSELIKTKQEQIADDINAINELLAKNKEQINLLKHKLSRSNTKIIELEKLINRLTQQIEEKDNEIALLKEELQRANSSFKELFIDYMAKVEEVEETKQELQQTNNKLNTAYFTFGTSKELIEKKVITKEGGFIGIGKAEKLLNNFNSDYFTQIDITITKTIDIKAKKCKIITTHPSDSYKWDIKGNLYNKLEIINPDKFWSASKYLVIVVEN
jgi:chromosome segregation ATPase